MYKTVFVVLALAICSSWAAPEAKPGVLAAYAAAPAFAPAVVTAQSSQVIARNYNGLVSPYVAAAPLVNVAAPYYNPYIAAPYVAAPYVAAPATVVV